MVPSIKGIAIQSVIEDVRKALGDGRLSRDAVEVRLAAEDLRAIDEEIAVARWYPIETFRRLLELLASVEAPGQAEAYFVRRGARAADRIAAAGVYRQLDLSVEQFGTRVGNLAVTVSGAIYNFTRWTYLPAKDETPGEFGVQLDGAIHFPDAALFTSLGFIQQIAARVAGQPVEVKWERPWPDRVIFRGRLL